MDFGELEAVEGVRLSWNVWPNSRVEATKCVVPFGALYTPLKKMPELMSVEYEPVRCKTASCGAVLNPFARVDFNAKIWICPFCYTRNHFPPHYASITEAHVPAELFPQYTTIEYVLPCSAIPLPPAYLFVMDTCMIEEELSQLKDSLEQALSLLPETALVGLITFGTQVHVHELGFTECSKSYIFRGSKDYTAQQIQDQLGLGQVGRGGLSRPAGGGALHPGANQLNASQPSGSGRFLQPLSECEFQLSAVLDEMQKDAFAVPSDQRAARCTGTALAVATGLLGACAASTPARVMAFVGGPATDGSGAVVSKDLSEAMRSHKDLQKDSAPHFRKATKYYDTLANQLVQQGHVLDIFACALDQVGLAEMLPCVERTGGFMVLAESFAHQVFKSSFARIFAREEDSTSAPLGLAAHGQFEVIASRDVKVQGVIGPCASLDKRGPAVAESSVGVGGTTAWKMSSLDQNTTLGVYFDVVPHAQQQGAQGSTSGQQFFLQFVTQYRPLGSTQLRLRCTSLTRAWSDGANAHELVAGFDQEAAAVLVARLATYKMDHEDDFDCVRWLDRMLIRLASKFGEYRKEDSESFNMTPQFSIYPQFMFNLRRSQFVQVANNSPDETAYFRMILARESVLNSLVMIQPSLISYSFHGPPEPALLDVASIAADRILLLDAFFSVVVFHGSTVAQWRKAGYQHQEEHAAFAQLLAEPQQDAEAIVRERFPAPRYVDCDQGGSQARFLLAKLNPSATYTAQTPVPAGGDVIFTDDVSLQVFMDHLKRLAVQS
eukprot:jgi/Chlat1/3600/Chrsp234S00259